MNALDALEAALEERPVHCRVALYEQTLDPEQVARFRGLLSSRALTHAKVVEALTRDNHPVSRGSVSKHRAGTGACGCERTR